MGDGSRVGLSSSVLFCLVSVSIKIIIIIIIKDSEQIFLMFEEKNTKVTERIVK